MPIPVLPGRAPILRRDIIRVWSAEPTVTADDLKSAGLEILKMTEFLDAAGSSVDHGAPPSMVIGLAVLSENSVRPWIRVLRVGSALAGSR